MFDAALVGVALGAGGFAPLVDQGRADFERGGDGFNARFFDGLTDHLVRFHQLQC